MFDLANPGADRLQSEQELWVMAAKELPLGTPLDIGMPKPQAELLIGGHAAAPEERTTERMMLGWTLGPIQKHVLVTGDRYWQMTTSGWRPTAVQPFQQMPLTRQRAFGGPGYAANRVGAGHEALRRSMAGELVALPNVESPEHAIQFIDTIAPPATFGPIAIDDQERLQYAGTYDATWLQSVAPALASDADPRLFLFAPPDQRLSGFICGGEPYALQNFSAEHPLIEGRLPTFRVRCFIGWRDAMRGVTELQTHIDTLWLFAGARRGVMIYRTAIAVQELDGSDVGDVIVAYERQSEPPRPFDHYLNVRRLRLDPASASRYAFSEHQLAPEISAVERARRVARRRHLAEERSARQLASMRLALDQEFARIELPPSLRPTIEIPSIEPSSIPELLPEELESGEIELDEILDALDTVQAKAESDVDKLDAQYEPIRAAYEKIASGNAESSDIDALLAAISSTDAAQSIDASFAQAPPFAELPDADPGFMGDIKDKLARAKNWRDEILDTARPSLDEQKQFELAHARFFNLAAGRPLEPIRSAVSDDTFSLPDVPALVLPEEARSVKPEAPTRLTIDEILAQIEASDPPPDAAQRARTALTDAEAALRRGLPALPSDDGAPFGALSAPHRTASADEPAAGIAAAKTQSTKALTDLRTEIDKAEGQLAAGIAAARLASPKPLKPDTMLAPAVARALGDLVEEEFRRGGPVAGRDLAAADLSGRRFANADFSGAFLERAKLNGTNLAGAKLMKAALTGATLINADLSATDLTEANLGEADCRGTRFAGSQLVRTNLLGARMVGACFDQAHLGELQVLRVPMIGATLRSAQIRQCSFIKAVLDNTDWGDAVLERGQFIDLSLSGASFAGARLEQTCFLKVAAAQLDLSNAQFDQVSFVGDIDLRDARFGRSSAEALSFQTANLSGADFTMARLNGAYFGKSTLACATFRMTSLKRAVFTANDLRGSDFYAANLLEAHLNQANLAGASLRHANLYGADLMDASLVATDLSNANIDRTVLMVTRHVN
ncbi:MULTISPECIES: DUF2169 domain-containing protein [unclassified Bradyrhizobium]|nr:MULTISPECIES: DUF2169 domain-containing protein [unclassified Bradyrhizobium]WGR72821.1 DUF2169 domain-containing protein [Bradyrhizobium sp. ISRA426]WGR77656.1 DUF2169 domain-containing protein [Bradyrhizobium sp. ISRA430]WGR88061.1 DUF2169 domain-containing protein [Bradyrhizobium sp. ISRA432]